MCEIYRNSTNCQFLLLYFTFSLVFVYGSKRILSGMLRLYDYTFSKNVSGLAGLKISLQYTLRQAQGRSYPC